MLLIKAANSWLTKLVSYFFMFILALAFLFDPDGSQYGLQLLGEPSGLTMVTASIVGDLAWVYGFFLWLVAIVTLIMVADEDFSKANIRSIVVANLKNGSDPTKAFRPGVFTRMVSWVSLLVALFGAASGFWFTGTGWALASALMMGNRKSIREKVEAEWKALEEDPDALAELMVASLKEAIRAK